MIDLRIWRTALLAAPVALLVAMFSLQEPPRAIESPITPDSFDSEAASVLTQDMTEQFAAYGIDYPCDLNGPQHIAGDYLAEPLPREGRFALVPQRPGIGVVMDEAKIRSMALKI